MKKLIPFLFAAFIALGSTASNGTNERTLPNAGVVSHAADKAKEYKLSDKEAKRLVNRLKEIQEMDTKEMNVIQKKELRQEVTAINEKLNNNGVSIYLSGAAIIIIILLIILL